MNVVSTANSTINGSTSQGDCGTYESGETYLTNINFCLGSEEVYSPCRPSHIDPAAAQATANYQQTLDAAAGHPDTCTAVKNTIPFLDSGTGLNYFYSTVCAPVTSSTPATTSPTPTSIPTSVPTPTSNAPAPTSTPPLAPAQTGAITSIQGYNPTTGVYTSGTAVQQGTDLFLNGTFGNSGNTVSVVTPSLLGGSSAGVTIVSQNASQIEVSLVDVPAGNHTITISTPSGATGSTSFSIVPTVTGGTIPASTPTTEAIGTTNSGGSCNATVGTSLTQVAQILQGLTNILATGSNLSADDVSGIQAAVASVAQVVAQLGKEIAAGSCTITNTSSASTSSSGAVSPAVPTPTPPISSATGASTASTATTSIPAAPQGCVAAQGGSTAECLGTNPGEPNGVDPSIIAESKAACAPGTMNVVSTANSTINGSTSQGDCGTYESGETYLTNINFCLGSEEVYSPCRPSHIDPAAAQATANYQQTLDAAAGHPDTCTAVKNTIPFLDSGTGLNYFYSTVCAPVTGE